MTPKPSMPTQAFRTWLHDVTFDFDDAAVKLGVSRESVEQFHSGLVKGTRRPARISHTIALACAAVRAKLEPWGWDESEGRMPPGEFVRWREYMGTQRGLGSPLPIDATAKALGLQGGKTVLQYWQKGYRMVGGERKEARIRKPVALACSALAADLEPEGMSES